MNMDMWRKKVMNQRKEWIIIHKKVDRKKLLNILFLRKNIPEKYSEVHLHELMEFKAKC